MRLPAASSCNRCWHLWLFERFDLSLSAASVFFFWTSTLSAFSYPVAAWLAKRVWPHQHHGLYPYSIQHLSDRGGVLAKFDSSRSACCFMRAALSQMDVPTRTSYVMAVVTPGGAHGRCQRHRRAAQPRIRDQSGIGRCPAGNAVFRIAAGGVRRAQDRL